MESVLNHFQLKNALTFENTQIIDAANTNRKKLTTLLSRLHGIDNGWDVLISYLDRTNRKNLARKLENAAKMPVSLVFVCFKSIAYLRKLTFSGLTTATT